MSKEININVRISGEILQTERHGEMFFNSEKYPQINGAGFTEAKVKKAVRTATETMLAEACRRTKNHERLAVGTKDGAVIVLSWEHDRWFARILGPDRKFSGGTSYGEPDFKKVCESVRQWAVDCFGGILWETI